MTYKILLLYANECIMSGGSYSHIRGGGIIGTSTFVIGFFEALELSTNLDTCSKLSSRKISNLVMSSEKIPCKIVSLWCYLPRELVVHSQSH